MAGENDEKSEQELGGWIGKAKKCAGGHALYGEDVCEKCRYAEQLEAAGKRDVERLEVYRQDVALTRTAQEMHRKHLEDWRAHADDLAKSNHRIADALERIAEKLGPKNAQDCQ